MRQPNRSIRVGPSVGTSSPERRAAQVAGAQRQQEEYLSEAERVQREQRAQVRARMAARANIAKDRSKP